MKKTVTVGIPAHNEEKNIVSVLDALLAQKGDNFIIEKIVVVCDGCSDNTSGVVEQFTKKHSMIKLIDDGQRMGQAGRLNEFYKNLKSDIFITFDADVTLENDHVIFELIKPFEDNKVGLVGGRVYPLPQKKFIGKILEAQEYFWNTVRDNIQGGDNLQSHTGPISAASKEFLKTVNRPEYIVANDQFLYFNAIKNNFWYKSAKKARVFIKVPTTFTDYMKQSTRFLDSANQIKEYFGEWTDKYYAIPYSKKLQAYFLTFLKYPLYLCLAIALVTLQKLLAPFYKEANTKGFWTGVASTK